MNELKSLQRTVKGIHFPSPIMVSGGAIKTKGHALKMLAHDVQFEWGSFTTNPLEGNGGRDYYAVYSDTSPRILLRTFNSVGLTNPGMEYVEQHGPELIKIFADQGKPFWINVSGVGADDTLTLMKRAIDVGFKVITVNGACPNKKDQPILCDDHETVDEVFERADSEIGNVDAAVFWKISAGMRRPTLAHNRRRVHNSCVFTGSIACNTVPNGFEFLPEGGTVIATNNGINRGGIAGPAIFPIALDHAQFMGEDLPKGKVTIGCGGASGLLEVHQYFQANAWMVQIQSAFREAEEDPDFMRDLNMSYNEHGSAL